MLKRIVVVFLGWILLINIGVAAPIFYQVPTEAPDLYTVQQTLIQYHDKGQYDREIKAVMEKAQKQLAVLLSKKSQKPRAIVFDIDETTLSNWSTLEANQFHYDKLVWSVWEKEERATPIQPALALYHYALDHDVAVFFVTGREESSRQVTEGNLKKAGYRGYKAIYFKPENHYKNAMEYKYAMRKKITRQGYDIVMSVGDQYSDLCGGYAKVLIKVSNPFYYIPGCSAKELRDLQSINVR